MSHIDEVARFRREQEITWRGRTIAATSFLAGVGFGFGVNPWVGVGVFFALLAFSAIMMQAAGPE